MRERSFSHRCIDSERLTWGRLSIAFISLSLFFLSGANHLTPVLAQDPPPNVESLTGQDAARSELLGATADSEGQQVFDILMGELISLIPFPVADGSDQKRALENAVTAFQIRDFRRASELLDQLASNNPGYPPADLLRAAISYAIRDADNGLLLLEQAALSHAEYPGVHIAFGRLALSQNRISDALAQFEKAARVIASAELQPESKNYFEAQCLDGLTDIAMRQQRYDDARSYLERQISKTPDSTKVVLNLAEVEFQQGNIDKSLENLKKLQQNNPNMRVPETVVATWFDQKGEMEKAGDFIKLAAEKYPNNAQVQMEFASYLVNQEDFAKAIRVIGESEKIIGETPFSRNLKARVAFCSQSYGVAEMHYRALAELQPDNFDAVNMYALSLIESKDEAKQKQALDIATRNFRSLSDNLIATATLGYISLRMGDKEQAKTLLGRAAASIGASPEIDFFIASYFQANNETENALRLLRATLERKGAFLYRKPARQMLATIEGNDELPPKPARSDQDQ